MMTSKPVVDEIGDGPVGATDGKHVGVDVGEKLGSDKGDHDVPEEGDLLGDTDKRTVCVCMCVFEKNWIRNRN